MPIIAGAYLSFISGLLCWYSGFSWLLPVGIVACGALIVARPKAESILLSIIFFGGLAVAMGGPPLQKGFKSKVGEPGKAGYFDTKREIAAKKIDMIFGDNAQMAKALLIADQSEISKEIKQQYSRSGLIHMLSISGLHVSIIAGFVELGLQVLRFSYRASGIISIGILGFYLAVLGFPPPAVRAGVMVAVVIASKLTQRPTSKWAALALGAFFPLIDPRTVMNLGYQLSVGGIAGLIASASFSAKYLKPHLEGWKLTISKSLVTSSIATMVTAPLVAWTFGQISIVGPIANLVADPVISIVQPILFLSLILAWAPGIARFIADAADLPLNLFSAISAFFASFRYAAIAVTPSPAIAVLGVLSATSMVVACLSRWPARATLVTLLLISAMLIL